MIRARLDMLGGMPLKDLDTKSTLKLLSRIMEFELAGVVRYTHYSLMVTGPNRIPIVAFMKAQASESLLHAQQAGELAKFRELLSAVHVP